MISLLVWHHSSFQILTTFLRTLPMDICLERCFTNTSCRMTSTSFLKTSKCTLFVSSVVHSNQQCTFSLPCYFFHRQVLESNMYISWCFIYRTSESKLNNFTRIEPILNLLGIPFDTANARDIMTERHGEATKLLYQLFIALNKKQKAGLTGTAMETMRPAAPAKLDYMKSLIYKEVCHKCQYYVQLLLWLWSMDYELWWADLGDRYHCGFLDMQWTQIY